MKRMLIVEDDQDNLELLELIFKHSDIETVGIRYASDISLQLLDFEPDLIILDVLLPDGNGFEICNSLKENEKSKHIPIILISAAYTQEKVEQIDCKADIFIEKPFNIDALEQEVSLLLENNGIINSKR